MPIQSSITKLLEKSAGSSAVDAGRIRSAQQFNAADVANAINSLQRQLDALTKALQQEQVITQFEVTGTSGSLIGWIGSKVVGAVSYIGAWFQQLYIGGTSAANAKIVADASGNVTINGATITLNSNGTLTTINNSVNPWSSNAASLTSTHVATGDYSMIDPYNLAILDVASAPLVHLSNVLGVGQVTATGAGSFGSVLVSGAGGNSHLFTTELQITNGTTRTMTLDNSTSIISLNGPLGNTFVQDDGVDTPSYAVSGTPGIDASDTLLKTVTPTTASAVTSVSSSISAFVTGVSVSTTTISYTAGPTSATFVDSVSSSSSTAVVSVTAPTATFVSALTPTTQTDTYTKGIRTA